MLAVDGDIGKKVVYLEGRGRGGGRGGLPGLGGGVGGLGGRKSYEIFAPSHPQAVNQYVRDYNYTEEQQQPKYDYSRALQQYNQAVSRTYSDILLS